MKKILMGIIVDFLNSEFYYSTQDKCVYSISNYRERVGYQQIENLIGKVFHLNEDLAHAITFNWLLTQDVPLVKKNWNRTYIVHNITINRPYNQSVTSDIDFVYKLVPNE